MASRVTAVISSAVDHIAGRAGLAREASVQRLCHMLALGTAVLACGMVVTPRMAHAQCTSSYTTTTPCGPSVYTFANTTGGTTTIKVKNTGRSPSNTYTLTCSPVYRQYVTGCSVSPTSFTLALGDSQTVTVTYNTGTWTGAADGAWINISSSVDRVSNIVQVQSPDAPVDTTKLNMTDQLLSLCANGCFAGGTAYSTVPFYTLDTPRDLTLVYTEERAHPRPVVYADVTPNTSSPAPTQYVFSATLNGSTITWLNGDTQIYFAGSSTAVRLAGQFDASGYTTGVYTLVITVTSKYSGGQTVTRTYTKLLAIVNEAHSPVARGWTIAGAQHLYLTNNVYLITDGAGDAVIFPALGALALDYSRLTYDSPTSQYIRTSLTGTKSYFNTAGQLLKVVDRLGFTTTYTYSGSQLTTITDPEWTIRGGTGIHLSLTYGTHGLSSISEVGGAVGRTTTVTVASDSSLQAITDPGGGATHLTYDASGRLATEIDRRGDTTSYQYDSHSWKLMELDLPRIAADAGGGSTVNVIPKMKDTAWVTLGVPTTATSSGSPATPVAQSAVHATVVDPIGRVTKITSVNRWGQPLQSVDPTGRYTTDVPRGILLGVVNTPDGGRAVFFYVDSTPLVSSLAVDGDSTLYYHYGAQNQLDSAWGAGRPTEVRYLDATTGRVDSVKINHEDSTTARYTYDASNRVTVYQDPGQHVTSYHYDAVTGNVDSVTAPGNLYAIRRFDAFGRDSAAFTRGTLSWVHTTYDSLNRMRQYVGTSNDTTSVSYDSLYPIQVKTPGGVVNTFEVNALGWTTKRYDVGNPALYLSYRYDTTGRMTSLTNRRGQRVDRQYDVLDRLIAQRGPTIPTDTFTYSVSGDTLTAWRPNVSRDSLYVNKAGRPDSLVRKIAGQRYAFLYTDTAYVWGHRSFTTITNDIGIHFSQQMHRIDYPGWNGTVGSYFVKDSLTGAGINGPQTTINRDGLPVMLNWMPYSTQTPIPSYVARSFTALHQDYSEYFNYPGHPRADSLVRGFTYDTLGRVTFEYRISGTGSLRYRYSYDPLGRLRAVYSGTGAACTATADTIVGNKYASCPASTLVDSVSYDSAGNMRKPGDAYAAGNRVTSWPVSGGTVTYTYDADGNVATRTRGTVHDTLYWSATGELDSLHSGGLSVWYEYNSFGQLVRRRHNGVIDRFFLWDGTHLIAELNASSGRRAQYIYQAGVDQPLAIATDSGGTSVIRNLVQDVYGNVIGITRDTAFLRYMSYLPWGLSDSATTSGLLKMADTNRLAWKGLMYEGDSTKLYYARSRWYDPQARRFLSEDPIGITGSLSLYTFGGNDPVNLSDPSGTCSYLVQPWSVDANGNKVYGQGYVAQAVPSQQITDTQHGDRWCACDNATWSPTTVHLFDCAGAVGSPPPAIQLTNATVTTLAPYQPPPNAPALDVGDAAVAKCRKNILGTTAATALDIVGIGELRKAYGALKAAQGVLAVSTFFRASVPDAIIESNAARVAAARTTLGTTYAKGAAQSVALTYGVDSWIGDGHPMANYVVALLPFGSTFKGILTDIPNACF